MGVGARQSFQFFRQTTWLLKNNRALSKFRYRILHYLLIIIKLQSNSSVKPNFMLITRTILKERIETFKPCRTWAAVSKQCIISNVWTVTNLGLINVHIYVRKKVKLATKKSLSLCAFFVFEFITSDLRCHTHSQLVVISYLITYSHSQKLILSIDTNETN